ncbi:hypothetical protein BGZ65_002435 [Modicella reniformis]|uniref:BTB domain-containing protein n=1 Tax=Modicella reniformis TaxID=1440133 RepID=A0A9P6J2S1_9FUNG|nr:hypothetical protein BGZ65_002435 [Modicella reniformis]
MSTVPTSVFQHMTSLAKHISTQGLTRGIGSDIAIKAFDKTYYLHRLILTQSTFFESILQGPWKERNQDLLEMKFDDTNITQEGFEIAIERLYGIWTEEDEHGTKRSRTIVNKDITADVRGNSFGGLMNMGSFMSARNVLSILATGAYLGMDTLCEQSTTFICRTLSTHVIPKLVQFCHNNSYHPWSDRIAEGCHTFLCRTGFDDPKMKCLKVFEHLPTPWLLNVLGSDAFWVPNEWERYCLCRQIIHTRRKIHPLDSEDEAAYDALFSTRIIYMHMTFEQLQMILCDIDPVTGYSFTPPEIIHEALWQQIELRALIERSAKEDGVLDIAGDLPESWRTQGKQYSLIPEQDKIINGDSHTSKDSSHSISTTQQHSLYSPFRFSAEFGDVQSLQENARHDSGTFFYAGSFWSMRIEKTSSSEGMKLGVYLHRHSRPQLSRPPKRAKRSLCAPAVAIRQRVGARRVGAEQEQQPESPASELCDQNTPSLDPSCTGQRSQEKSAELSTLDISTLVPIEESSSGYVDEREKTKTWIKFFATSLGPTHTIKQFQCASQDLSLLGTWGWSSRALCSNSYMPEDFGPKSELEGYLQTACTLQPIIEKGERLHMEVDKEQEVEDLTVHSQLSPRNKGAGSTEPRHEKEKRENEENGDLSMNSGEGKDGAEVDVECACEAQTQYGRLHHHHDPRPLTLKFSIVMGFV